MTSQQTRGTRRDTKYFLLGRVISARARLTTEIILLSAAVLPQAVSSASPFWNGAVVAPINLGESVWNSCTVGACTAVSTAVAAGVEGQPTQREWYPVAACIGGRQTTAAGPVTVACKAGEASFALKVSYLVGAALAVAVTAGAVGARAVAHVSDRVIIRAIIGLQRTAIADTKLRLLGAGHTLVYVSTCLGASSDIPCRALASSAIAVGIGLAIVTRRVTTAGLFARHTRYTVAIRGVGAGRVTRHTRCLLRLGWICGLLPLLARVAT